MRVVVGLVPGSQPGTVADVLRSQGAQFVQGPMPSLPDVLVAEFPDEAAQGTLAKIAALPGVRYAEPDALQSTAG